MTMIYVVSLSGGRDSAAVGIWTAEQWTEGKLQGELRYVHAEVGDTMEPDLGPWLDLYEERILRPRGLVLERVNAKKPGYRDAWASVYERSQKRPVLPGPLFRTCTWRLKIEPLKKWRNQKIGKKPVCWIVGFRADEGAESRRVQVARFADPETGDDHWRPFVELGATLTDVKMLLQKAGVPEPNFYQWTTRSGCIFCFYKPARELARAARLYPKHFEHMANHEEAVIRSTGKRGSSPWLVTRGGTLREIKAAEEAQVELVEFDLDERNCGDPLGTCTL